MQLQYVPLKVFALQKRERIQVPAQHVVWWEVLLYDSSEALIPLLLQLIWVGPGQPEVSFIGTPLFFPLTWNPPMSDVWSNNALWSIEWGSLHVHLHKGYFFVSMGKGIALILFSKDSNPLTLQEV